MAARSVCSVRIISLAFVLLALAGCGHIGFYEKPGLGGDETGVRFYTPKPYLLVTRTQAKEASVKAEIFYLPDISKPIYATAVAGMGSSDLSMTFKDGMLVSFGQKTDTKIPETLTALGGLTTSAATLAKTLGAGAEKGMPEAVEPPVVTLYEIDNSRGTTVLREVRPVP